MNRFNKGNWYKEAQQTDTKLMSEHRQFLNYASEITKILDEQPSAVHTNFQDLTGHNKYNFVQWNLPDGDEITFSFAGPIEEIPEPYWFLTIEGPSGNFEAQQKLAVGENPVPILKEMLNSHLSKESSTNRFSKDNWCKKAQEFDFDDYDGINYDELADDRAFQEAEQYHEDLLSGVNDEEESLRQEIKDHFGSEFIPEKYLSHLLKEHGQTLNEYRSDKDGGYQPHDQTKTDDVMNWLGY